jgi:hypothetical protein
VAGDENGGKWSRGRRWILTWLDEDRTAGRAADLAGAGEGNPGGGASRNRATLTGFPGVAGKAAGKADDCRAARAGDCPAVANCNDIIKSPLLLFIIYLLYINMS